jgi:hypothetical protein
MKLIKNSIILLIAIAFLLGCGDDSSDKKSNRKTDAKSSKTQTIPPQNEDKKSETHSTEVKNEPVKKNHTLSTADGDTTSTAAVRPQMIPSNITPDMSAQKITWTEQMIQKIDLALDKNPVAIAQNLPHVQTEILQKAGFQLSCDEGWGGFKNYELIQCYTAIKALLIAIRDGLSPRNPVDGISIEEIKIVKGESSLYEPIYGRHGLEVNYLITATEWPALLKTEIEGFARTRRLYRNNQVNDKTRQLMQSLKVKELVAHDGVPLVDSEKGIHSLEQAIALKEQMHKKSSALANDILNDKIYEGIRIAKKAKDLYEDDGQFYVDISYKHTPLDILKHLVRQPNKDGKDLNPEQLQLLGLAKNTTEYQTRAVAALQNYIMRAKIKRLKHDIQYLMLEGKVEIEINLDRTVNCSYWVFCKSAGVTIAEAYKFLMDLREAISGGRDLTAMKVKKIEFRNKILYEGIISDNNQHILFGTNAVATSIYNALWYTTPEGMKWLEDIKHLQQPSPIY